MSDIKLGQEFNYNPPAFPAHWNGLQPAQQGMTLRDWFAGQALAGALADSSRDLYAYEYAESAYEYADAMLKAREMKP